MASSQAQASFQVIRWTSGFCQIWNNDLPGVVPFQKDHKAVSKKFKTIEEAWSWPRRAGRSANQGGLTASAIGVQVARRPIGRRAFARTVRYPLGQGG
jgi:hypothetical protein